MPFYANVTRSITFALCFTATIVAHADPRGPWKIVNFWSITCAPCRIEIPELNALSRELETKDVVVLGINYDEDPREETLALAKRMGIEFPTLAQDEVDRLNLAPPSVLPTTLILTPGGDVQATLVGAQTAESIRAALANLPGATH